MKIVFVIAIVAIVVILFFVNNGISGTHFDSCKIIENTERERAYTVAYHPFKDENGVPQLYKYDSAWGYKDSVLSYEQGWGNLLDTSDDYDDISFVGWQCDEWKKMLQ
jgi:hypothetical protein